MVLRSKLFNHQYMIQQLGNVNKLCNHLLWSKRWRAWGWVKFREGNASRMPLPPIQAQLAVPLA